jgi:hypothetical protein
MHFFLCARRAGVQKLRVVAGPHMALHGYVWAGFRSLWLPGSRRSDPPHICPAPHTDMGKLLARVSHLELDVPAACCLDPESCKKVGQVMLALLPNVTQLTWVLHPIPQSGLPNDSPLHGLLNQHANWLSGLEPLLPQLVTIELSFPDNSDDGLIRQCLANAIQQVRAVLGCDAPGYSSNKQELRVVCVRGSGVVVKEPVVPARSPCKH